MKRLFLVGAIRGLGVAVGSIAWAASNLNSSRSNIYRVVYDTTCVNPGQAAAIGAALDKAGPTVREDQVAEILKRQGVRAGCIKKIVIRLGPLNAVLLLTNPADEAAAIAVGDPGAPADKSGTKK